jgi:hypothetical protein
MGKAGDRHEPEVDQTQCRFVYAPEKYLVGHESECLDEF